MYDILFSCNFFLYHILNAKFYIMCKIRASKLKEINLQTVVCFKYIYKVFKALEFNLINVNHFVLSYEDCLLEPESDLLTLQKN